LENEQEAGIRYASTQAFVTKIKGRPPADAL
jgi:hypothetical protein